MEAKWAGRSPGPRAAGAEELIHPGAEGLDGTTSRKLPRLIKKMRNNTKRLPSRALKRLADFFPRRKLLQAAADMD